VIVYRAEAELTMVQNSAPGAAMDRWRFTSMHQERQESESAAHRPLVLQPQAVIGDDGRDADWTELPKMLACKSAPPRWPAHPPGPDRPR
jgi:hypothetical protein